MCRVVNARAILLDANFALEVARHAVELGNHRFDLRYFASFLVNLKLLEPNKRLSGLHRLLLPGIPWAGKEGSVWRPRCPDCGAITLAFGFHGGSPRRAPRPLDQPTPASAR